MISRSITKKNNLIDYLLLWGGYALFLGYNSTDPRYILVFSFSLMAITAVATYMMVQILIPKYLFVRRYTWFGFYLLFTILFTTFCVLLLQVLCIGYLNGFRFENLPLISKNYVFIVLLVYFIVAIASYNNLWRRNTQVTIENSGLQQELLAAKYRAKEQELAYLKSQIHPHFLFNTLNTIYGLSLRQSVETPDVILKLSKLLDYILYQSNKPKVPLIDEIAHLEEYIALETVRFSDTLKVSFSKQIMNQTILVAPMLLLPFVENAFKHGSIIDEFLSIALTISTTDNALHFNIKNTYKTGHSSGGLGLENIKERLEILYPKQYELQINTTSQWFEVDLKLTHLK